MEPVELVTNRAFSRDELITALLEVGVKRNENPHRFCDFVIGRDEAIVWVDPDDPENYPDPEVDALIESKLGGAPQTYIVLHISREPGSEQLAMELAIRFASRWPCVLDNLSGLAHRVFTLEELQALYKNGLGLYEDEKGIPPRKGIDYTDEEYTPPEEREELEREIREWLEEEEKEKKTFPEFEILRQENKQMQRDANNASYTQ